MGPPTDVTTRPSTFAVITGGGTSGHVVPALALAELLMEDGIDRSALHYLGTQRGVEARLVPAFGIAFTLLNVRGVRRSLRPMSIVHNLGVLVTMVRARRDARRLLETLSPRVVVSVGGYGSVPGCAAAKSLGIPVVTCSYDRRPGLATRRQARYASAVAVAHLPSALPRATLTGAPVRASLRHLDVVAQRASARDRLGVPDGGYCIVVVGGSLGSRVLNDAVAKLMVQLDPTVSIVHVTGERYLNELGGPCAVSRGIGRYVRMGSTDVMSDLYGAADVVVARAGASTVAEVATVGVAAVLVPWKDAADDHQTDNARWLADERGAVMVADDDVDAIVTACGLLIANDDARLSVARHAHALGALHRQAGHAALVRSVAR